MFFLSSQQLSPSLWPLALPGSSWIITCTLSGFSSLGICPLALGFVLHPKPKYQLLEEPFWDHVSPEGTTQSLGDSRGYPQGEMGSLLSHVVSLVDCHHKSPFPVGQSRVACAGSGNHSAPRRHSLHC